MLSLFLRTRILKNRLWHRYFPVNFAKLRRTSFLQYTSRPLLLFRPSVKFWIMQLANIDKFKFDTLTHLMPLISFLYPMQTSENQRFSDDFWEYRKRRKAWNELNTKTVWNRGVFKTLSNIYDESFLPKNKFLTVNCFRKEARHWYLTGS